MSAIRQLPAYGKVWADARRRGQVPLCGSFGALVLLDHWRIAHKWPFLVIAQDRSPASLDFTMLKGLEVTLAYHSFSTPDERLIDAVKSIMRDGAQLLVTLDRDNRDKGSIHRQGKP